MAEDPYGVLGVARTATADEIRRAFRDGAKKSHPDLHPGDAAAEARFKALAAANDLLSDPDKRAAFDRGEIDGAGAPRAPDPPRYRDFADGAQGARYRASGRPAGGWTGRADETSGHPAGGWRTEDLGDIFADMFGDAGAPPNAPRRGADEAYALSIGLPDAVRGAKRRLTLPDGRVLDVAVPAGVESGQVLRLRERGGPGRNGGPAGDALIELHVEPHPFFRRDGADIHLDLPVTLREAVLGARVTVPTPGGSVAMTVPARSESGRVLRLRGRGVAARGTEAAGDLYVTLRIAATEADDALAAFVRDWTPAAAADPRRAMMEASS